MIHEKYNALSTVKKIIFTGRLLHAVMHKEKYFDIALAMIDAADKEGIFDNVEILPERQSEDLITKI